MCDFCNKPYAVLAETERYDQASDELTLSAKMKLYGVDGNVNPLISVTMTAGHSVYLMPELEIPIEFCPFCGEKLEKH